MYCTDAGLAVRRIEAHILASGRLLPVRNDVIGARWQQQQQQRQQPAERKATASPTDLDRPT